MSHPSHTDLDMNRKLNLLIAEDNHMYLKAVKSVFEELPYINRIEVAMNGRKCIEILEREEIDVVLLDIQMPELTGLECLKIIRKRWPDMITAMLTQFGDYKMFTDVWAAGPNGFMLKSLTEDELIDGFETLVFKRGTIISKNVEQKPVHYDNIESLDLSETQLKMLPLFCEQKTAEEVAEILGISVNTIKYHRKELFKKAGVRTATGLGIWAMRNGFANYRPDY